MAEPLERDGRDYYDDFSRSYDDRRASAYHRMIDDLETQVAAAYARDGDVLELGCGTGLILERMAPIARKAVGIDFSEGMLRRARSRGLDVRLGDISDLPFEDASFDLTYAFKVLPHVRDTDRAIREAVRVTRVGGHVLLELYNPWSLRYLAKKVAGPQPIGDHRTETDIFTRWDSPLEARRLVPPQAELVGVHGVRVLTPFAALHRMRVLGPGLRRAEALASRSALRYFGGFLLLVLRRAR